MSREAGESTWAFLGRVKKRPLETNGLRIDFLSRLVASLVIGLANFLGRASCKMPYVNNDRVLDELIGDPAQERPERAMGEPLAHPMEAPGMPIEGPPDTKTMDAARHWQRIHLDLSTYKNQSVVIRLYDLILIPGHEAGNSYWKKPQLQ